MEIDFLVTRPYVNAAGKPRISPIEVKSPRRYGTISLDRFRARFNKKIGMAYVLHPKQLEWDAEAQLAHLPLYMAFACRDLSTNGCRERRRPHSLAFAWSHRSLS